MTSLRSWFIAAGPILILLTFLLIWLAQKRFGQEIMVLVADPKPLEQATPATTDSTSPTVNSDCLVERVKKWPDLEIFLPVAATKEHVDEFRDVFLPSYLLFWPLKRSSSNLLIIVDEEERLNNNSEVARIELVAKSNPAEMKYRMAYQAMPKQFVGMKGHDRQQWIMFWADNFTDADYVGFIDTDAPFVTRVTLNDLFDVETMRPIVRPLYGMPHREGWYLVPPGTERAIGRKSPFSCMTYFPVVFNVSHLALIREHIRLRLNQPTFDDAFWSIVQGYYSQFDIMCAYLWYFQQNQYVWAIGQRDPNWKGPIPNGQVANMEEAGITPDHLALHGPRVATHGGEIDLETRLKKLKNGICYSMLTSDPLLPSYCASITGHNNRMLTINIYEWTFEGYVLTLNNMTFALEAHRRRLEAVDQCRHNWLAHVIPKS